MAGVRLGRPPGRSVENVARRRRQLVEAAIDSIVEYGFSGTTLAKVSTAAGLSQGTAVFYFKTKEALLEETLRQHYQHYQEVWQAAVREAGEDPIDKIVALVMADLNPEICNRRTIALWNSFWGEVGARPRFAKICDDFDAERDVAFRTLCKATQDHIDGSTWTAETIVEALDMMTDGLWIRMHISPQHMSIPDGRRLLARFFASVYPSRAERILADTEALNRSLAGRRKN